jgi:cation diffusion facilitator CzcD-associated flavoprotein CzcO
MNHKYDAIVIGGGQAGPSMAARFAAAGKSVAIIDRHLFGGTCVNSGCTPTKTLIANVGGRPRIPVYPGLANVPFLTSTSLLELPTVATTGGRPESGPLRQA